MAKRPIPTPEMLRQLLDYDPETGTLTWRERPLSFFFGSSEATRVRGWKIWNAKYPGRSAGVLTNGYISVKIFDRMYLAHRIIWAMVHGVWRDQIDHINGNPNDNRLSNLRSVSQKINQRNQRRHKTNTSGRTGVSWNRFRGCWVAYIRIGRQTKYLGGFQSFDMAVSARQVAEKQYGFTGRQ